MHPSADIHIDINMDMYMAIEVRPLNFWFTQKQHASPTPLRHISLIETNLWSNLLSMSQNILMHFYFPFQVRKVLILTE
jgi:hypothetical protein